MIDVNNIFVSKYDEVILQCTSKIDATNKLQRIQDALNLMNELEQYVNNKDNEELPVCILKQVILSRSYDPLNK
jgi:hypothetical protein